MASSDITVSGLSKIGNENAEYLVSKIRTIPGFPKEGILFRDFMPVLADARAFGLLLDALEAALPVAADEFDIIAGLEARGFLFGPALAARLGKGFIAVRKAGKLPPETVSESYDLEYGQATVEIDVEKRKELYAQIQQGFASEGIFIPLLNTPWNNALRNDVTGWIQTPLGNFRFDELAKA